VQHKEKVTLRFSIYLHYGFKQVKVNFLKFYSAGKSHSFLTSESSVWLLLWQIIPTRILDRALAILQGCLKVLLKMEIPLYLVS